VSPGRSHLLLVNPSAGGGRVGKLVPEVERALRAAGVEHRLVLTDSLEHGCEAAREAASEGTVPVVMSGDGLIGQVGGELAGGEVPMGIIPGGRGNDLARVLGIPSDLDEAARVIAEGVSRPIDGGEVNGRRFLGIASCGFDSDANRIANEARFVRGRLVYLYAALRALAAWKPARFTLVLDGERRELTQTLA
jgi:diacylglycerol kinase family enzyme